MGPQFKLDSGHDVYLQQMFFKSTDEGFLEGSAPTISALVMKHLPRTIRDVFWDCEATLILKPEGHVLPPYTFIAHLQCNDTVPDKEEGYYSRLIVAWFGDDIDSGIVELAHDALRAVDWNQHAENWID